MACLWRLTWSWTRYANMSRSSRGPLIWIPSRNAAPEVAQTQVVTASHTGTPWTVTEGRSTSSRIWGWPSQVWNVQSDVSGTDLTPIGYRDTAGEANTRLVYIGITGPRYSGVRIDNSRGQRHIWSLIKPGMDCLT